MVNSKQSRWLVLLNEGHCTLYYHLTLEQCSPEGTDNEPLGTGLAGAGAGEVGSEGHRLKLLIRPWLGVRRAGMKI